MRKILGNLGAKDRHAFQAVFGKYGYKRYHDANRGELYSPTIMVRNLEIIDDPAHPQLMSDHLWLNLTKRFVQLGFLQEGDLLQFKGRVSEYSKGFINKDKRDYELTYPSQVKLLTKRQVQPLPESHQALIGLIMNLNYKFYFAKRRPLVPYFMDAFAQWQKEQDQPLPVKCHQGNSFENSSNYDPLNYRSEKEALAKKLAARKENQLHKQQRGIALMKANTAFKQEVIALTKKNEGEDRSFILSNRQVKQLLAKYALPETAEKEVKQALTSSWFKDQIEGQQNLTPLEQLARKFNQH